MKAAAKKRHVSKTPAHRALARVPVKPATEKPNLRAVPEPVADTRHVRICRDDLDAVVDQLDVSSDDLEVVEHAVLTDLTQSPKILQGYLFRLGVQLRKATAHLSALYDEGGAS
jgi:hypothetical protein